jgi:hypothetical protein
MTSALENKMRSSHRNLWRGLVTFGLAPRNLRDIMPASKEMQAWAMPLLMSEESASPIQMSIAAVDIQGRWKSVFAVSKGMK